MAMENKKTYLYTGIVSLALFLITAIVIKIGFTTSPLPLDRTFENIAWATRNGVLTAILGVYTWIFGDLGGIITTVLVFALLATILNKRKGSLYFGLSAVVIILANTVIKDIIGRVRPMADRLPAYINESGQSFPSGHSAFATIFFGCLFLFYVAQMRSQTQRIILGVACGVGLFLVMFSRVYIGVHYPSDTLGGFLLSLSWLAFTYPYFLKFSGKKHSRHSSSGSRQTYRKAPID